MFGVFRFTLYDGSAGLEPGTCSFALMKSIGMGPMPAAIGKVQRVFIL